MSDKIYLNEVILVPESTMLSPEEDSETRYATLEDLQIILA